MCAIVAHIARQNSQMNRMKSVYLKPSCTQWRLSVPVLKFRLEMSLANKNLNRIIKSLFAYEAQTSIVNQCSTFKIGFCGTVDYNNANNIDSNIGEQELLIINKLCKNWHQLDNQCLSGMHQPVIWKKDMRGY